MEKDNQTAKGRVIIYMEGGLLQKIVSCDQPMEVIVHDDASDADTSDDIIQVDGEPVFLTKLDAAPDPQSIPTYLKFEAAIEQDNPDTDIAEEEEGEIETFTCPVCNREVANLCDACGACGGCCACFVGLILSAGYEWTCPICGKDNQVISIVEEVTCRKCGKKYPVDEANHAYD